MDSALMFAAYQAEQDKLRQQPKEENNLVDALGKAALAAGVATAGILGGRRFFANRGAAPTSVLNTSATTDLSNINVNNLRRASGRPPIDVTETVVPSRPAPRPAPQTTVERLGNINEITRQARSERPQGIKFVDLADEVRTSVDPWSGKETILTPFGSPTVPPVRKTETITRGTPLLSPAVPDAVDRLLDDSDFLKLVEAEELAKENLLSSNRSEQAKQAARKRQILTATGEDIISTLRLEANTAEAAAQGDFTQQYLKTAGYKDVDTMVDQQVANVPRNTNQTLNAIDAAEDQQTGRVYQQLQRNEGLDLNQIEIMEDMAQANRKAMMEEGEPTQMVGYEADASINQVASQLPDGLPVDQAEGALSFAQKRMQEIRKVQEAQGYRGLRAEKQMLQGEQGTRIKQASELYAATGDPNVLSLISETPSLPISVQPKTQQLITTQSLKGDAPSELNTSSLYSPFKERELNVNKQEDVDMRMTNRLSELGAKRETIPKKIINPEYAALEEQTNIAMYAMEQGDPTAANIFYQNRQKFREGKAPPREIINPEYLKLSQQMNEAESLRREVRDIIESKKSNVAQFPSVYRVADLQEGVRPFYQQTPEGEIIPETLELRRGRPSKPTGVVEKPASGTSIRGVGGAVGTGSGSTPGVYEPGAILSDVIIENGEEIYKPVMWQEGTHPVNLRTPEGYVYSEEATQQPTAMQGMRYQTHPFGTKPPEVTLRSFDAAKEIRRIQRSNPPDKAQALVNSFLQQLKGG
ncbi:MAG: hypothetical protein EBT86_04530 [Actinobacteria bacterium]|nr:hypothetical protein [Actinomycetota bacterium]